MPRRSDHDMVQDFDLEQLPGPDEVPRHLDVSLRRFGLAARVVVLCDVSSYVQCPVGGADTNAASTTKGVLWMRLNRPSNGSLILPSAS